MSGYDVLLLRVEHQDAEIERLRADFNDCNLNRAHWKAEAEKARNRTIEECARVAMKFIESKPMTSDLAGATYAAIRALKDKP